MTIKFGFYNPRRNLPPNLARKRGESNYVVAFERHFLDSRARAGVCGRNFALSGYGIADFIYLATKTNADLHLESSKLTAFEMKLWDWKKALQQAYRYSYFADESIVVLPPLIACRAMQNINLFKTLEIGLWSFDTETLQTQVFYTPKNRCAKKIEAKGRALSLIRNRIDLC